MQDSNEPSKETQDSPNHGDLTPGEESMDTGPKSQQPDHSKDSASTIGRYMIIGFWVLLLAMAYLGAERWFERAANLNRELTTSSQNGRLAVELQGNRYGHYIATGHINSSSVVFLVDTGASSISIPQIVADRLQLKRGRPQQVITANGPATVYEVTLASVGLGDLVRERVQAHINPHLGGEEILLGMTYLRHFDLLQRGETLSIIQP